MASQWVLALRQRKAVMESPPARVQCMPDCVAVVEVFEAGGARERAGRRGQVVHRGQARRHRRSRDSELGITGSEAVPAGRAVIPGPGHCDQAEDRVEGLAPVALKDRLSCPFPQGTRWSRSAARASPSMTAPSFAARPG